VDNLKIVYKILVGIEASMDSNRFDCTFLEALKISEERRNKILQSMIDDGLIDGFTRVNYAGGYAFKALEPRLTIKGMEFLQEKLAMQKIKNSLKDIKFVCNTYFLSV
jgi:yjcQ protein